MERYPLSNPYGADSFRSIIQILSAVSFVLDLPAYHQTVYLRTSVELWDQIRVRSNSGGDEISQPKSLMC